MEVEVIKDSPVLVPCETHRNFRATHEFIPKGTKVRGNAKIVAGLQRGKPFNFHLFFIRFCNCHVAFSMVILSPVRINFSYI